jgi:predicted N-acetyltransferase YhbS
MEAADVGPVAALHQREPDGSMARRRDALHTAGSVYLAVVAERDAAIIAEATFCHAGVHGRLGAIVMGSVYVAADQRSGGVGRGLVGYGLEACRNAGVPIVFSVCAPAFFEACGFSASDATDFVSLATDLRAIRLRYGAPLSGRIILPEALGA